MSAHCWHRPWLGSQAGKSARIRSRTCSGRPCGLASNVCVGKRHRGQRSPGWGPGAGGRGAGGGGGGGGGGERGEAGPPELSAKVARSAWVHASRSKKRAKASSLDAPSMG